MEGVLLSHPHVKDAGVIGVEDGKWGQIPVAFIVKKANVNEQEIIDFAKCRLAKYKVPKKIYFIRELPRNASKKLVRRKLREMIGKDEDLPSALK